MVTGYTVTSGVEEIKLLLDDLYHYNYCLLGCNTMYSSRNLPTFQCNFMRLHDVTHHNTVIFTVTTVRT